MDLTEFGVAPFYKDFNGSAARLARFLVGELTTSFLAPEPIAIVQRGVALLKGVGGLSGPEKKTLLIDAIKMIAKGADGVPGTHDDAIPEIVVDGLRVLIESQMLDTVIEFAYRAYAKTSCLPKCLNKCLKC